MAPWLTSKLSTIYAPVAGDEDESQYPPQLPENARKPSVLVTLALAFLIALISGSIGFAIGRVGTDETCRSVSDVLPGAAIRTADFSFEFNSTFAEAPSVKSNAAWEAVFPPHGGFFHDPVLAPHGASLAVYHQLHCVDSIRMAYYTLLDAVNDNRSVNFTQLDDYQTDWHTRHCIDFLRQMLMCNADLTIEEVDPSLGGITGFGLKHKCVVWDDVLAWSFASQDETNNPRV
ncbi:hypothetical protein G7054_g4416 [Neopestalotiopsis clavispora]|nr:hypothetical protein G7054_g4416 [Neopestalotiopsis clavispora]